MDDHNTRAPRRAVAIEDRRAYLDIILAGDLDRARRLVDGLLGRYWPERIILDVLAPAQREIGDRWESNQCSIADEHVATSITDAVLAQVGGTIQSEVEGSLVAVGCVEGDWHTVPARMAAELLRAQGWRVRFLGGSLPADHLYGYLVRLKPAAACLSCSLPFFLPGALRSIEAAHRAGVPVLAGGRGFGHDDHVALRLGADAWARSITTSKRQLTAWSRKPPRRLAVAVADTESWSAIELALMDLVDRTMTLLATDVSPSAREDTTLLVELLAVSLLVDDDRIFVDFLAWLNNVEHSREGATPSLGVALPALSQALKAVELLDPRTERLLESATAAVPAATPPA